MQDPRGGGLDTRQAYVGLLNMGLLKMGLPRTRCALPSLGAQGLLLRHCTCKAYSLANGQELSCLCETTCTLQYNFHQLVLTCRTACSKLALLHL